MSKIILITGSQGSGKNILTDLMSYDHERILYDDLRRKQQLAVCKSLKGLDKVIIDQCYSDIHIQRIVDICRNLDITAVFVANQHMTVFEKGLFDVKYSITAEFCDAPLFPPRENYFTNEGFGNVNHSITVDELPKHSCAVPVPNVKPISED